MRSMFVVRVLEYVWGFSRESKGKEASGYFMILLVGILCYVVGIKLIDGDYKGHMLLQF